MRGILLLISRFLNLNCQICEISHKSELKTWFWDFNSRICGKGLDV